MARASLIELEAVATVARTGGFRAAARELEMSSSALSHAIATLEARLGVRLFNRTTRSVALSAAGEQFVAEIAPALAAIGSAIENVGEHGAEPSGILRLNTSLGAARMLLAPLILEYGRRYPRVEVEKDGNARRCRPICCSTTASARAWRAASFIAGSSSAGEKACRSTLPGRSPSTRAASCWKLRWPERVSLTSQSRPLPSMSRRGV
jgi:hypothetical protein